MTAAFAGQESGAGIVFAFVFGCAAAVAAAVGHITAGRCLRISIGIVVTGVALAFFIRAVIRAELCVVQNISVAAGKNVTGFLAGARFVFATAPIIGVVVRAAVVKIIRQRAGGCCITCLNTKLGSRTGIIFAADGIETRVAAVAGAEKTDGGKFK